MAQVVLIAALLTLASADLSRGQPAPGPGAARPVVLEFSRKLCPICREMEQVLLKLQADSGNQFEVRILHIDEEIKLFRRYQVSIVPTLIFLDAMGKTVWRYEGHLSREQLARRLREFKFIRD